MNNYLLLLCLPAVIHMNWTFLYKSQLLINVFDDCERFYTHEMDVFKLQS